MLWLACWRAGGLVCGRALVVACEVERWTAGAPAGSVGRCAGLLRRGRACVVALRMPEGRRAWLRAGGVVGFLSVCFCGPFPDCAGGVLEGLGALRRGGGGIK